MELDNIASRSVRGLSPTDAFWRPTQLGVPTPVPLSFARRRRAKLRGTGRFASAGPLERQNEVGGGQAPDQPERQDRRT